MEQGKPNPHSNVLADVVFGPSFTAKDLAEVSWKALPEKVKAL